MLTALDAVPRPITPGAEMAALLRFHRDITWTGSISAGGMGPGTPAMTAQGSGTHTTIQDGRWVVGDYRQEQYLLDGTHVLTWQLHWVADCDGHAEVLRGRIDTDRLVFESTGDPPVRIRLTWDASDPATIVWRNETSTAGGPWSLIEEYRCTPLPPPEPVAHGRTLGVHRGDTPVQQAHAEPADAAPGRAPALVRGPAGARRPPIRAELRHPVVARPVPGGFAIPLAYGRDVDWHRNLAAAGHGGSRGPRHPVHDHRPTHGALRGGHGHAHAVLAPDAPRGRRVPRGARRARRCPPCVAGGDREE